MTEFLYSMILRSYVSLFFLMGSFSLHAQADSPFAIPGRPPPPKIIPLQPPPPKKMTAPVKKVPSPYDLRGYYKFDGKWHFALYHKTSRESRWLIWEANSTAVEHAGEKFVFDSETFEVSHESSDPKLAYEVIGLAEASKPSAPAFNPTATPTKSKGKPAAKPSSPKPPSPKRPGPIRPGLVIPRPTKK